MLIKGKEKRGEKESDMNTKNIGRFMAEVFSDFRMKGKIALIVDENRHLSTYPSVYNTAKLLSQYGYDVDLFLPNDMKVDYNIENVNIIKFRKKIGLLYALIPKIKQYNLVISYHTLGFIISSILCKITRVPYAYFCLEIIGFDQKKSLKSKLIKYIEIFLNKGASFTVVQDENRKKLIKKIHKLNQNLIFCIPNSYIGTFRNSSKYLRDKFNIPNEKIIVLYSGAIEFWAIDDNFIKAVGQWDKRYVLVLHGFSRDNYLEKIKPLIKEINMTETKIYISSNILNVDEYMKLIASADIGLVWYKRDLPINVSTIGLSSGKFSAFLRCGVPIIVPSYLQDLYKFVNNYKIGTVVKSEYEIESRIVNVIKNYDMYRDNAFKFYSEYLDFEEKFKKVFIARNIEIR
jgi:hypothetical protein